MGEITKINKYRTLAGEVIRQLKENPYKIAVAHKPGLTVTARYDGDGNPIIHVIDDGIPVRTGWDYIINGVRYRIDGPIY